MTLWEVNSSALVSESKVRAALRSLSGLLKGTVDEEESDDRRGTLVVTALLMLERAPNSCDCEGTALTMLGERAVMLCFSLIDSTIFSNRNGDMRLCLARHGTEGCISCGLGRWMLSGADFGSGRAWSCTSLASDSADESESTLSER